VANVLINFAVVFFLGYTVGVAVVRLRARRCERLRRRRIAPRGLLIVQLRVPREPQAVRRSARAGGVA